MEKDSIKLEVKEYPNGVLRDSKGYFVKGSKKQEGTGKTMGQKTRRTLERENEWYKNREEIQIKAQQYTGLSIEQVLEAEDCNLILELISIVKGEYTKDCDKIKALDIIAKKIMPDKRAIEQTVDLTNRIEVVFGPRQDQDLIDSVVTPLIEDDGEEDDQ